MNLLQEVTLYKNHGNGMGYWTARAFGDREGGKVQLEYAKKLDGKAAIKEYAVEKKNIGRSNETTFMMQAVYEMDSRAKKQLDKGYVRTQEEATQPVRNSLGMVKPMLAHPIDKVKPEAIDWENAYFQPKVDGHRCLVNGILYSRGGKEIHLPHIREQLGDFGLLDAGLDGELYIHGMMLQDIGSLIKKPREESLQVEYHVYDIIRQDMPYGERYQLIQDLLGKHTAGSSIEILPALRVHNSLELESLHQDALGYGYEGSMLRHGLSGYQDGKRSAGLLKVKTFEDSEFTVIGVERGKPNGEYEVPVWICVLPDGQEFRVTAQGTMQEKDRQWDDRLAYIGESLTVQFFGYSKSGVPLLPVALRWREDV